MCRDIEIKILASTFGAMPFEYLKISEASIRKLRVLVLVLRVNYELIRKLRVLVETDLSLSRKLRRDECLSL